MKAETFNNLITRIDKFIAQLEALRVASDKPSDTWTIAEANSFREKASVLQGQMDKHIQADLYHLIGMGNLNARQLSIYMKRVKEMTSYRPMIHTYAGILAIKVPTIGKESKYTTAIGNIDLKVEKDP